ncbi:MAG: hypothetical protein HYX53_16465 [Chloroflexi bacterium]|nr:hypothetical protein [Chloroflexota bacterium]
MEKDYYEPLSPRPANAAGEIPEGSIGTMKDGGLRGEAEAGGIIEQAGRVAAKAQLKAFAGADVGRERAASGLATAAGRMRERAEDRGGMQAQFGAKAADAMGKTAGYLREHDSNELWDGVRAFIKEHPMQAAAGALFAGYFIGKMMRR